MAKLSIKVHNYTAGYPAVVEVFEREMRAEADVGRSMAIAAVVTHIPVIAVAWHIHKVFALQAAKDRLDSLLVFYDAQIEEKEYE